MTKTRTVPSETGEWQDGRTLVPKWSQGAKLLLQPRSYLNFWFWGLWYSSLEFTTTNNQDYKIISWDLWIIFSIKMLWFFPSLVQITFVFIISLLFQTLLLPQLSLWPAHPIHTEQLISSHHFLNPAYMFIPLFLCLCAFFLSRNPLKNEFYSFFQEPNSTS